MKHIDQWYHRNGINNFGEIHECAKTIHTDSLPNTEFIEGLSDSEAQPDTTDYFPSVDEKRVTRQRYIPYKKGTDLWRKNANNLLASMAQANFQRR